MIFETFFYTILFIFDTLNMRTFSDEHIGISSTDEKAMLDF